MSLPISFSMRQLRKWKLVDEGSFSVPTTGYATLDITLPSDGLYIVYVYATGGLPDVFYIELFDSSGNQLMRVHYDTGSVGQTYAIFIGRKNDVIRLYVHNSSSSEGSTAYYRVFVQEVILE